MGIVCYNVEEIVFRVTRKRKWELRIRRIRLCSWVDYDGV